MHFRATVLSILFALTSLIAVTPTAATSTASGTSADQNGAELQPGRRYVLERPVCRDHDVHQRRHDSLHDRWQRADLDQRHGVFRSGLDQRYDDAQGDRLQERHDRFAGDHRQLHVEQLEIGLRFTGLNIPRNATVTAAYIQFEADKSDSGASSLTLRAELSANAAAFTTTANNITNRPLTGASVAWSPPAWTQGDRGAAQNTPDLKALVQAVVNQATWNAGNAIVFVITGTGTRTAEAFESGVAKAPQLRVEWQ